MLSARLFLGFPVNSHFAAQLSLVNPDIVRYFVQQNGEYLIEVSYLNQLYLGKYIEGVANFAQLELLETHIYSLLKRIAPEFAYREVPLILFPLIR
ncbi:MAG: hypothetical protein CK425_10815 [Parachlamydia sp.]|nr:MAG: hypothetical protein CK425_10815 [Parachlamydia sp.]